jgi:hypothetical protein
MTSKFRLVGVGVALVAVFAMFAIATSAAMAEDVCVPKTKGLWLKRNSVTLVCEEESTNEMGSFELIEFLLAEWLLNGNEVTATLLVTASSTGLGLIDLKATLGVEAEVLCNGSLDGFIGENGADEITEALSLGGASISLTALSGTALLCAGQKGCETSTEGAEVWAVNLPWLTLLQLYEEESPTLVTGFVILISPHTGGGNPGWYVQCKTLAGTVDDECTAAQGMVEATNPMMGSGVTTTFSEAFTLLVGGVNANCTASSENETGVVAGVGEETSEEGTLTVSSLG